MVTSKKDQNNQEISRQKLTRGDPYKIRTTGKGNEHLPALIPLRRGLVKGPCLKTKTIITKDFLLSKVSDSCLYLYIKFIYSEKATKFDEISTFF